MDEPTEYVYTGEDARTYEGRSLDVQRGDTHPWPDGPPDYRWSEVGSDEANEALADKAEREAAEAGGVEEPRDPDAPQGSLPEDGVKEINNYLDTLKAGDDPSLYESARQRLINGQTRKGLTEGRHANPDGAADGSDLL
jgi:hypothetical protein